MNISAFHDITATQPMAKKQTHQQEDCTRLKCHADSAHWGRVCTMGDLTMKRKSEVKSSAGE